MKILHKTSATATGGRSGVSKLDDDSFEVNIVPPGSKREGVNPEQLFAIGLAQLESGGYGLDIDLYANIAGLPEADAHALLEAAHKV